MWRMFEVEVVAPLEFISRFLFPVAESGRGLSACLRAATAAATLCMPGKANDPGGRPLMKP